QWQSSSDSGATWTDIHSATGTTYTLATTDEGDLVRFKVTASNPDGTVSAVSTATSAVLASAPVNTALPAITGQAQRGTPLTASQGTWSGNGNSYTYQWQSS